MNPHCEAISATEVIWGDDFFACSYFSPLLKSMANHPDVDHTMEGNDVEGRDDFIELLESRFLFLAADARSTLRSGAQTWGTIGTKNMLLFFWSSKISVKAFYFDFFL